ncbi:unnamed protein product [Allacma fusca]|uniref:Uncharacterized protein n=1 Tax=Allacma fusca TaxID=39272 RepID=A0A8J2JIE8_9HEXA|nr:unnamed protein product [Allacma fusca]
MINKNNSEINIVGSIVSRGFGKEFLDDLEPNRRNEERTNNYFAQTETEYIEERNSKRRDKNAKRRERKLKLDKFWEIKKAREEAKIRRNEEANIVQGYPPKMWEQLYRDRFSEDRDDPKK